MKNNHLDAHICFIYQSPSKSEMYLYVNQKDTFDTVPGDLLKKFGSPVFTMMLDLSKRESLARESLETVKQNLINQGYHLQLPPLVETLFEKK